MQKPLEISAPAAISLQLKRMSRSGGANDVIENRRIDYLQASSGLEIAFHNEERTIHSQQRFLLLKNVVHLRVAISTRISSSYVMTRGEFTGKLVASGAHTVCFLMIKPMDVGETVTDVDCPRPSNPTDIDHLLILFRSTFLFSGL